MNVVAESCSHLFVDLLIVSLSFVLCVSESSANANERRNGLFLLGIERQSINAVSTCTTVVSELLAEFDYEIVHRPGKSNVVAAERVRADRRSRARTQEFANLTVELLAGRRGPEVQLEGMRIGVKVEKPETYSGKKSRDLDTWLFQVREHLEITTIPARGHVPYAASLLRGNVALWWREVCEGNRRPATWDDFCRMLRE